MYCFNLFFFFELIFFVLMNIFRNKSLLYFIQTLNDDNLMLSLQFVILNVYNMDANINLPVHVKLFHMDFVANLCVKIDFGL